MQTFREIEKEKAGYLWKVKPELGYDAELGLLKEQKPQVGARAYMCALWSIMQGRTSRGARVCVLSSILCMCMYVYVHI